jgi:hypothetical protein
MRILKYLGSLDRAVVELRGSGFVRGYQMNPMVISLVVAQRSGYWTPCVLGQAHKSWLTISLIGLSSHKSIVQNYHHYGEEHQVDINLRTNNSTVPVR